MSEVSTAEINAALKTCCRDCWPTARINRPMLLCPDCGNKRCPKARNHKNTCTGSNEPGQKGSAYA